MAAALAEGVLFHNPRVAQRLERSIDSGERDSRVVARDQFVNLVGAGVALGFRYDLRYRPSLAGEFDTMGAAGIG